MRFFLCVVLATSLFTRCESAALGNIPTTTTNNRHCPPYQIIYLYFYEVVVVVTQKKCFYARFKIKWLWHMCVPGLSAHHCISLLASLSCCCYFKVNTINPYTTGGSDITFEAFVERYGKTYAGGKQEIDRRRSIFEENRASVIAQNKAFTSGLSTWWAVINEFADRTKDELQKMRARFPIPASDYQQTMVKSAANPIESDSSGEKNPPAVSWMQYQTPVKNQGGCGSCWAFATTEVLESHLAISENGSKPIVLAPQTLVSWCVLNKKITVHHTCV